MAELWRHGAVRERARDGAEVVRPRHYALRSREQLRAAAGIGRGKFRAHPAGGSRRVSRRDRDIDEGGLSDVARAVWRSRLAEVSACESRSELAAYGSRIRRYL